MTVDPLTTDEAQVSPEDLNEEDKVMLVFSYLWVLAIVPFMVTRREYVRWHAKQGLILCGVACLVFLGVIFVGAVLATISRIFAWLFAFGLINLLLLYLAIPIRCAIRALWGGRSARSSAGSDGSGPASWRSIASSPACGVSSSTPPGSGAWRRAVS